MSVVFMESVPIGWLYVGVVILMLVFFEIGYQLGVRVQKNQGDEHVQTSLGPMVGGLLGMLAFFLAFTFSMAYSQHEGRKLNVLEEANSIGTAYLRTDLLDKQRGREVKRLLKEYVELRLNTANPRDIDTVIDNSIRIHGLLWNQVSAASLETPNSNTMLMVQAINQVIDMHERRLTGAIYNRIPVSVWVALTVITVLTMITMGTQVGLTGSRGLVAVIPLALAFAVLVTLVVDLNRPQGGLMTVGQQSMIELHKNMTSEIK